MSLVFDGFGYIAEYKKSSFVTETKTKEKKERKPRGVYKKLPPLELTEIQKGHLLMIKEYLEDHAYNYLIDISNDLGLKYHTFMVILQRLERKGAIYRSGKHIEILKSV
jgi:DNA-binding MarR family transcriptional regulator